MQVHNVECQLAQAQMNLYLAGEAMDEDTVAQLERHVGECDTCRVALQQKKHSLQSMLMAVGAEAMSMPTGPELRIERPSKAAAESVVPAALRPKDDVPTSPKVRNWKPIILSGALALVLAGMSFLGDPTRLFGGKAADAKPKAAAKAEEPEKTSEESKQPVKTEEPKLNAVEGATTAALEAEPDPLKEIDPIPVGESEEHAVAGYSAQVAAHEANGEAEPHEAAPVPAPSPTVQKAPVPAKPKPVVKRATAKRKGVRSSAKRRVQRPVAPKKAKGGGIKVYDSAGKPVGH